MNNIVQFSSFISVPEIITKSRELRPSFSFLAMRDTSWNLFEQMLLRKEDIQIEAFMRGFSTFRWNLRGPNLSQSIHTMRLRNDHQFFQRPILPIISTRKSVMTYRGKILDIFEQVRIYPACFCEYRMQITSPIAQPVDKNLTGDIKHKFRTNLPEIRRSLSLALFGNEGMISTTFSDVFIALITTSENPFGSRISLYGTERTTIRIDSNVIVETSSRSKRVFIDRIRDAFSLVFAYRVVIPVLWTTLLRLDFRAELALREIIEIIFLCLSPKYYTHSNKLTPHILSKAYQRKVFEFLYKALELNNIESNIKNEFIEWLDTIPLDLMVILMNCSQPLRGELARTLRKLNFKPVEFDLSPPASTIFTYLTCAYLQDRYLMYESPDVNRFTKERLGLRTANQILNGTKNIEMTFNIEKHVEKTDIYKVPSKMFQILMEIGIIASEESHKTSAPMAFRINPDSPTAISYCLTLQSETELSLLLKLGA